MGFRLGDILMLDDKPCVVVGLSGQVFGEEEVPEDHIAVWFGDNKPNQSNSKHEQIKIGIEVWTIPAEYFKYGPTPVISH